MIRDGIRRVFDLALRRRDRWEREVEDEITLHLALRAEQLAAEGMPDDEARREAVRRFGPLVESRAKLLDAAYHRETRMQRTEFLADARQDLAFAFRTLGRQKAWTAITIGTLALGVGATTAVFSVVSRLLLHPVPYPHANRMVYVEQAPSTGNNTGIPVNITPGAEAVRAWRENSRSFEALEPQLTRRLELKTTTGDPSSVQATTILPSFAEFAGERPLVGRVFNDNDIRSGARVILLGEGFWRDRLGANRSVLGQALTLGDSVYAIVGVMPSTFSVGGPGARPTDVWLPLDLRARDFSTSQVLGRLKPGVSIEAARRELDAISARTAGRDPASAGGRTAAPDPSSSGLITVVSWPSQRIMFRDSLLFLTAAVALVLMVACVNVAHLLLARSATRQREMAVRAALGAGRGRLFRQLLTESLLLAGAGAACGVGMGWAMLRAMIAMRPSSRPELKAAHLDVTTLAVVIGVALVSGVFFGLLGAVQASRSSTHDSLRAGSLGAAGGRGHSRIRSLLVVSEMALSAMLIVGAALVVRSLSSLQHTNLGFDPRGLYAVDLVPRVGGAKISSPQGAAVLEEFADRVRHLPGVRAVSATRAAPGWRYFSVGRFEIEGEAPPPKSAISFTDVTFVHTNYFATMGISFREGSNFRDTLRAAHEVIVNEGFARAHWARGQAAGHRIRIADADSEPWMTIVGVVNDALTTGPMHESHAPFLYVPVDTGNRARTAMVRIDGGAASLKPAVDVGHQLGMRDVTIDGTEAFIYRSLSEPRFVMMIMSVFGALGLLLAAIGLFGVMSYTVTQQTREIGIRVALGASSEKVVKSVVRRGAALAVTGAIIGLVIASWGTKLIETQLHGVERLDPISFAAGAIVLVGAALAACVVPARRALAVDPMTAIRAE
jgi:putative ABC transport system permease protein